jgi:hypothetical protein
MLPIFSWPAEPVEPRKRETPPVERPRQFEAMLARSYAEMRARRKAAA